MTRTLRSLSFLAVSSLVLAACNSGTKAGDTNVELNSAKQMQPNSLPPQANGDSLAAGIMRDTTRRPTGKQIYKATSRAVDRNHDGIAD